MPFCILSMTTLQAGCCIRQQSSGNGTLPCNTCGHQLEMRLCQDFVLEGIIQYLNPSVREWLCSLCPIFLSSSTTIPPSTSRYDTESISIVHALTERADNSSIIAAKNCLTAGVSKQLVQYADVLQSALACILSQLGMRGTHQEWQKC